MPGTARLITDGASCLFWVRGDGGEPARYRQCQPQARGPSSPQSRALVTGPGRVLLLAALLLFLLCPPLLSLPLTAGRWLPGRPGHGGGAERQSSPPRTHGHTVQAAWHLALAVKEWPPCSRCFCSGSQFSLSCVTNADKAGWQSSGRLPPSLKDVAFVFVSETLGLGNFRGAHSPMLAFCSFPEPLGW